MNRPVNTAELKPAVTTGPLPSSRKIFVTPDEASDVRVPLREIMLSEGAGEPNLPVYDTSGPYTDPAVTIDVNAGLPRNRIILSAKVSAVQDLIAVYSELARRSDYALHLGLTEAGMGSKGIVASAAAMGVLLQQGIGDLRRDDGNQLSLIGNVKRVQPQHLAGGVDLGADRERRLRDADTNPRGDRQHGRARTCGLMNGRSFGECIRSCTMTSMNFASSCPR